MHINMLEAKSSLSKLVQAVEEGHEAEIIIARHGRPAARLVPLQTRHPGPRVGVAKGRFIVPEQIDSVNSKVADLFNGD